MQKRFGWIVFEHTLCAADSVNVGKDKDEMLKQVQHDKKLKNYGFELFNFYDDEQKRRMMYNIL